MKKLVLFLTCAFLCGAVFTSCKPSDEKLQQQVVSTLSAVNSAVSGTVKDGVATLSGTVNSEDAKTAAEAAVKVIKDIKSVTNNIKVVLPAPPVVINPDDTLSTAITTALTAAGFSDVKTAVADGVVTLTGTAKKADFQKIMQIANESKPKQVINKLTKK